MPITKNTYQECKGTNSAHSEIVVNSIGLISEYNQSHAVHLSHCFYNSGFTAFFYTRRAGCYVALPCYSE